MTAIVVSVIANATCVTVGIIMCVVVVAEQVQLSDIAMHHNCIT